jgi:hypothetical protein
MPALEDAFATTATVAQVRQALTDLSAMPDWLESLERHRLGAPGVQVHVDKPQDLSERQRRLLAIQGMAIAPWSAPGVQDQLTAVPEYWVKRVDGAGWIVYTRPLDVSPPQEAGPGELVVLRAILWIDALDALSAWERSHPAPRPPDSLLPDGVAVNLLPSTANNQLMASSAAWVLVFSIMALIAVIQMSRWEARRSTGAWVPLAGLTHDTLPFLWVQALMCSLQLAGLSLLVGLVAGSVFWLLGISVDFTWVWRLPILLAATSLFSFAVSTLLGAWPSGRETRQGLAALWILSLAFMNMFVAISWASLRPQAAFLSSAGGVLGVGLVVIALAAVALRVAGWRLDRVARRGYQVRG